MKGIAPQHISCHNKDMTTTRNADTEAREDMARLHCRLRDLELADMTDTTAYTRTVTEYNQAARASGS